MRYNNYLTKLWDLFHLVTISHWLNHGKCNIGVHEFLGELYEEILKYLDELVEINLSLSNDSKISTSYSNINVTSETESLNLLLDSLSSLRLDLVDSTFDPLYDDWKSRLISTLNHAIFILRCPEKSLKIFSDKNQDPIVSEIRRLFKNQTEFVTKFTEYVKTNKESNPEIESFFNRERDTLQRVVDAILLTNAKLFDLRGSIDDDNQDTKIRYNELVKFFDIFVS